MGWMRGGQAAGQTVEVGGSVKGFCLVISSHSLPSGVVVRWLACHPGGQRACAGPLIQQRSGPGFHLGYSGKFS